MLGLRHERVDPEQTRHRRDLGERTRHGVPVAVVERRVAGYKRALRKAVELPETRRGDLIAIRTAGAYGEVMTSAYNLRPKVASIHL